MFKYLKLLNYEELELANHQQKEIKDEYTKTAKKLGVDSEIICKKQCKLNNPSYSHEFCHCIKSSDDTISDEDLIQLKLFYTICN